MSKGVFTFMVFNRNTIEHPVYEAVCISGNGRGYGRTVEDAVEDCRKHVKMLAELLNMSKVEIEFADKAKWIENNNPINYGYFDWDDPEVIWKDFTYEEVMK